MPKVAFTPNLKRHVECATAQVNGATVREALEQVFANNPKLSRYILDDQQAVRKHVVIFVDNKQLEDRIGQSDAVTPTSEIYVMQALSGG